MKRKLCYDCNEPVVHPNRKYSICLDCLIEMLIKEECITMPVWYLDDYFEDDE